MKIEFFFFLMIMAVHGAWAQAVIPNQVRAANTFDRINTTGGVTSSSLMYGLPLPPGERVADFYFDTKWNKSAIMLFGREHEIVGYTVKYDLPCITSLKIDDRTRYRIYCTTKHC